MRIIQCWQLRPLLTAYVDNEISALERPHVENHLLRCQTCRSRMRREAAVRQRFQRWSAESREAGTPLSWPAASATSTRRRLGTLLQLTVVSAVTITFALLTWNQRWGIDVGVPLAAQGRIGGSQCALGHLHKSVEMKDVNGRDCVRLCVMSGAKYVFISRGVVYSIRNQDFSALTRFAGQDVQVEGNVRENMLTVKRVRPLRVRQGAVRLMAVRPWL